MNYFNNNNGNNGYNGYNGGNYNYNNTNNGPNRLTYYKGILVDPSWLTPEIIVMENSDELINKSGIRSTVYNRGITNMALTRTTQRILYKMDSDSMTNGNESVMLMYDPNGQHKWGMKFRIVIDPNTRTKNVYVDHYADTGTSNNLNRNNMNIMKVINTKSDNDFGICFGAMVSETNLPTHQVVRLYIDTIYSVISYIEHIFMSGNYIKRNRDGIHVMSANMYDLLTSGRISVGGILIKPTIYVDGFNNLTFDIMLDFSEEISVNFKGDFDYMSVVK